MQSIRIGIIGIGNMGSAHAVCVAQGEIKGLALTAVCDLDEQRRQWATTIFSNADVAVFEDYKELLKSGLVDAVLIATPHKLHPVIAKEAFAEGLHVLIEKPAGVCVSQVRNMIEAASTSGKTFGIMWNQRTNPLFAKARELVQSGKLGIPKRLVWIVTNWYRTQQYYDSGTWRATWDGEGGGVLLNQAPHNLDLWQWIFGMPKRVFATCNEAKYHHIQVEDDATIFAEYENGASAVFMTSTGELPGTNRLELTGDRGKIVIENGKLTFWQLSYSERDYCFAQGESMSAPEVSVVEFVQEEVETAHKGILQNFSNHILNGEPLLAHGLEGVYALELSNAAYLSAWTGKWISLSMSDEDCALFDQMLEEKKQQWDKKVQAEEPLDGGDGQYKRKWNVNW